MDDLMVLSLRWLGEEILCECGIVFLVGIINYLKFIVNF